MTVKVDLRKLFIIDPSSLTSRQRRNATYRIKSTIKKDIDRLEKYWDLIMKSNDEKLKQFIQEEISKATFVENKTTPIENHISELDDVEEESSPSDAFWGE